MRKYWLLLVIAEGLVTIVGMSLYADRAKPVWAKFVIWPDGVVAWAVIFTLMAVAWQSIETKESANATLLNVQALIKIARPWVIVYVDIDPTNESTWNIWAKNVGDTPAMLIGLENDLTVAKNESALPETPAVSTGRCNTI